jgi:hypothetical protein
VSHLNHRRSPRAPCLWTSHARYRAKRERLVTDDRLLDTDHKTTLPRTATMGRACACPPSEVRIESRAGGPATGYAYPAGQKSLPTSSETPLPPLNVATRQLRSLSCSRVWASVPVRVPDNHRSSIYLHQTSTKDGFDSLSDSLRIRSIFACLFGRVGIPKLDVAGSIPVSRSTNSTTDLARS